MRIVELDIPEMGIGISFDLDKIRGINPTYYENSEAQDYRLGMEIFWTMPITSNQSCVTEIFELNFDDIPERIENLTDEEIYDLSKNTMWAIWRQVNAFWISDKKALKITSNNYRTSGPSDNRTWDISVVTV